jgi:hypothetical protein
MITLLTQISIVIVLIFIIVVIILFSIDWIYKPKGVTKLFVDRTIYVLCILAAALLGFITSINLISLIK